MDTSGSIVEMSGKTNVWNDVKKFISDLVNSWDVNPNLIRVALATFDDKAVLQWDFNKYKDEVSLQTAVQKLVTVGGETDTASVFDLLNQQVLIPSAGSRNGIKKVVIIISDGKTDPDKVAAVQTKVNALKNSGVHVIGVGVGPDFSIDKQQFRVLVSDPFDKYYFALNQYPALITAIDDILRVATGCKPRARQP